MKEYILKTCDLCYEYPDGTKALQDINIEIERGKKIAFLGVNGSGKSTLFLNFNGVLKSTKGKVFYKENEIKYNRKSLVELRKNVGIVFQDPENQLFASSVYEEVSFGPMNLKIDRYQVKNRVEEALKAVGMYEYKDKPVHFLSYGQKKRVSIADVLVMNPEVIIFDEPTSSLDPVHSKQIVEIFNDINKKGITVILSTHDVNLAYSWADYIIVMKNGKIAKQGIPLEVFSDDKLIQDCYLEKPVVLDIYEKLLEDKNKLKLSGVPKNVKQLKKIIGMYKEA